MAYRLYRAGKLANAKAHGIGRSHRPVGAYCGVAVYADTIEDFVNEEFYVALRAWYLTKTWGMANGNLGWANEDADYIEAITALENEQNAIENEEMEKASAKGNKIKETKTASPGKMANALDK